MFNGCRTGIGLCVLISLVWTGSGCDKPPAASPRDVLDYVRNGQAGASVRRLDDISQTYVDTVFKAYHAWQDAAQPLAAIADLDTLWAEDAAEWREAAKVTERIKTVFAFLSDGADTPESDVEDRHTTEKEASKGDSTEKKPKSRVQLHEALLRAIDAAPQTLTEQQSDLAARIRAKLGIEATDRWYATIANDYRNLLAFVVKHSNEFDRRHPGLTFTDADTNVRGHELWSRLHKELQAEREADRAFIQTVQTLETKQKSEALEEKQELRRSGLEGENERSRYRELELLVRYYDARKKTAEALEKKLDKKQATPKEDTADDDGAGSASEE
ncbi:MAG: hypothetical protein ACE5F9_08485 [Phycisphaerae bacterium]